MKRVLSCLRCAWSRQAQRISSASATVFPSFDSVKLRARFDEVATRCLGPPRPHARQLATGLVGSATLFAFVFSPRESLYWYVFPLFGIGACYLVQVRSQLSARWKLIFGATGILSFVAQVSGWPFSGHVLWNVLFIGHAYDNANASAWMLILAVSLSHIVALKIAFQSNRDLAGAVLSAGIALLTLQVRSHRD